MKARQGAFSSAILPPLYLITDADRVGVDRLLEAAEAAVAAGLRWIQVREPTWEPDRVESLIARLKERLRPECHPGFRIVVGHRPELARSLGLSGVHLGGGRVERVIAARELLGPDAIVGYSAHSLAEITAVAEAGADYVSYSPIFASISKTHSLPPLGLDGLRMACERATVPVYALGGVIPSAASGLRSSGAAGAAMIGAILDASDPGSVTEAFLLAWSSDRASSEQTITTQSPAKSPAACEPER